MKDQLIERWLEAESAGRDAAAEEALFRLIGALPMAAPSPGFADRVLAGAGVIVRPWRWPARLAVAGALLSAGLACAWLLPLAFGAVQLVTPGELLASAAHAVIETVHRFAEALAVGRALASLGETLWRVATSLPVLTTLLLLTTIAALALRSLTELLTPQRSPEYVHAHG